MSLNPGTRASGAQRLEQRAADWLIDLVFPPCCGHCGRVDFRFCDSCLRALARTPLDITARSVENLDALCATGAHQGLLQNALQAFKYDGATHLAGALAARLSAALRRRNWQIDLVLPVPLFADRLGERGYNQSQLLSQIVAETMDIKSRPEWLTRIRGTRQQARLSQSERHANVKDAFSASARVDGLSVLLIDDVVTTGSTLRECAGALRAKGAGAVFAITVSCS